MSLGPPDVCSLCIAANDSATGEPFLYNRKLLETPSFVVLPSLGPLFPGHVMVVSKEHVHSLAAMGDAVLREYDDLSRRLREGPFFAGSIPLEAEHGSTSDEKAGACVVHTHVHWIPGVGSRFDELRELLPPMIAESLTDVVESGTPYIFLRAGHREGVFAARGLPSQTVRRLLCEILDRGDSDWTQSPRLDWVAETVKAWSKSTIGP